MRYLTIMVIMALGFFSVAGCAPHTTGDTEVGVRTKKFAIVGEKGVEKKVYAPGSTYFFLPFINDWHTFDTKLQNLEMTFPVKKTV